MERPYSVGQKCLIRLQQFEGITKIIRGREEDTILKCTVQVKKKFF